MKYRAIKDCLGNEILPGKTVIYSPGWGIVRIGIVTYVSGGRIDVAYTSQYRKGLQQEKLRLSSGEIIKNEDGTRDKITDRMIVQDE